MKTSPTHSERMALMKFGERWCALRKMTDAAVERFIVEYVSSSFPDAKVPEHQLTDD